VLQLASPLNLKSAQVYIREKTATLPVTDNRSLEKACNIVVQKFAVLAVSSHRLAGEPSFYWYQVTVLTDVTLHFVCWHVYALLPF